MQTGLMERGRCGDPAARSVRQLALALAAAVILLVPVAHSVEMPSLYTVEVPFDRSESNAQTAAYRAALTEVLVRVTGTTAVIESEQMATLFSESRAIRQSLSAGSGWHTDCLP